MSYVGFRIHMCLFYERTQSIWAGIVDKQLLFITMEKEKEDLMMDSIKWMDQWWKSNCNL